MNRLPAYLISFSIVIVIALISSYFTKAAVNTAWYECIKSNITPPKIVFPIVWTILYALIAIALAESLTLPDSFEKSILVSFFIVNLILNITWSFSFFEIKNIEIAFINIILLVATQLIVMCYLWVLLPKWVFWVVFPYILWLIFAFVLNALALQKKC